MRITIPHTATVLHEVLLSHDKNTHTHTHLETEHILPQLHTRVLTVYLDTYSLERVSIATGSLDSTTSRSNLESVWHCVSDSLRCFEGQEEKHEEVNAQF